MCKVSRGLQDEVGMSVELPQCSAMPAKLLCTITGFVSNKIERALREMQD
jgi:hypothetical protein